MAIAKANCEKVTWIVVVCLVAMIIVCVLMWQRTTDKSSTNSFETCKDAGGSIAESYPEQCFIDGKSFVNTEQSMQPKPTDDYIGLTEQAALDKAKTENKTARVVQRDDESLPITMDLQHGRINLYIRNGTVEKITVENIYQ